MLNLESRIKLDDKVVLDPNLTDKLTERDLTALGNWVWDGYNKDRNSREKWERRTQAAMDLATQLQKDKNFHGGKKIKTDFLKSYIEY